MKLFESGYSVLDQPDGWSITGGDKLGKIKNLTNYRGLISSCITGLVLHIPMISVSLESDAIMEMPQH